MKGTRRVLWLNLLALTLPMAGMLWLTMQKVPPPWSALLVALAALIAIGSWLATARYAVALLDGGRGELLLFTGERIPRGVALAPHLGSLAMIGAIGGLIVVYAAAEAMEDGLAGFFALVPLALVWWFARPFLAALRTHQGLVALVDLEPDAALRFLEKAQGGGPAIDRAARILEASARLARGEVSAAEASFNAAWTGGLDELAIMPALLRLHRGDADLADRWLSTVPPDNRYQRYGHALLAGHRALLRGRSEEVLAAVHEVIGELPPYTARELVFLQAAALHALGRRDEARSCLAPHPELAGERWRGRVMPHHWEMLHQILHGRSAPPLPEAKPPSPAPPHLPDPFAPPDAHPRTRSRGQMAGPLPAEWLPLDLRRGFVDLLLVLFVSVLALTAAGLAQPGEDHHLPGAIAHGVSAAAMLAFLIDRWIPYRGDVIRLSDGRRVPVRWAHLRTHVASVVFLLLAPPLLISLLDLQTGWGLMGVVLLPFALAPIWRWGNRAWRLVAVVHGGSPHETGALAEELDGANQPPWAQSWVALGYLVAGRLKEAEASLQGVKTQIPQSLELLAWLSAARGELDVRDLLSRPVADDPDARLRLAVTLALAALQAREAERVVDRVPGWRAVAEAVPNRFGALLHVLNALLLQRAGDHAAADTYRARHAEELELGGWALDVWPFLASLHEAREEEAPLRRP